MAARIALLVVLTAAPAAPAPLAFTDEDGFGLHRGVPFAPPPGAPGSGGGERLLRRWF